MNKDSAEVAKYLELNIDVVVEAIEQIVCEIELYDRFLGENLRPIMDALDYAIEEIHSRESKQT